MRTLLLLAVLAIGCGRSDAVRLTKNWSAAEVAMLTLFIADLGESTYFDGMDERPDYVVRPDGNILLDRIPDQICGWHIGATDIAVGALCASGIGLTVAVSHELVEAAAGAELADTCSLPGQDTATLEVNGRSYIVARYATAGGCWPHR